MCPCGATMARVNARADWTLQPRFLAARLDHFLEGSQKLVGHSSGCGAFGHVMRAKKTKQLHEAVAVIWRKRGEDHGRALPSREANTAPTASLRFLTLLHQLGPIFAIFGASDRDKSLDLKV